MQTIVVESYAEWVTRHGQPIDVDGRYLVCPDGAFCPVVDGDMRAEPSDDPREKLTMRIAYARKAAKTAEQEFNQTRAGFAQQANLAARFPGQIPSAPENAKEILKDLKAVVLKRRADLEGLVKSLDATQVTDPERLQWQQHRANLDELGKQAAATLADVNSVTL